LHLGLEEKYASRQLVAKVNTNINLLEEIASEMFFLMSRKIHGTSMEMKVDSYNMVLKNKPTDNPNGVDVRQEVKDNVGVMWFY
jgi:hypothetical protein